VNLSYGTNDGSHNGQSLFETYLDVVAGKGRNVIVVATGNEGAAKHHYTGRVQKGQSVDVTFSVAAYLPALYLTMWKDTADVMRIELLSPDGDSSGALQENKVTTQNFGDTQVRFYYGQPTPYHKQQEVYVLFTARNNFVQPGIWTLRLTGEQVVRGDVQMWLPTAEEVTDQTAFFQPTVERTLTLPSTARRAISVAGYNSNLYSAAPFSGRGFICTENTKPDLTAPAVDILTTRAGGGYDSYSGTSMAAPFVTGAAALLMEWGIVRGNDPFLYGERLKAFLTCGARRVEKLTYPNAVAGYGTLCVDDALRELEDQN
jgi:subtilisin family serine protease